MNSRSWTDDWARCDACRRMFHPDELETLCDDELCPSCFEERLGMDDEDEAGW